MGNTIWTVGHSTRSLDDFIGLLERYGIEVLVDVRTVPKSRTNPQFNRDTLETALPDVGIGYIHAKDLGGLRHPRKDSPNTGWRNESFRGYADYMQTPEFEEGLSRLLHIGEEKKTAIMCAEAVPWRCHRSLIADALTVRGFEVIEILDERKSQPHKMTHFAVVEGLTITYPPEQGQLILPEAE